MNTGIKLLVLLSLFLSFSVLAPIASAVTLTATPNPPAASNTVIDIGQNAVVNTILTGGMLGYTYNWFWVAPGGATGLTNGNIIPITTTNAQLNGAIPANVQVIVSPLDSTHLMLVSSNTVLLPATTKNTLLTSGSITGTWAFNAFVVDANGIGPTYNTVAGGNTAVRSIIIYSTLTAPSAPTVSATNGKLDVDQVLTVSGTTPSTGAPTYSWQWLVSVNSGGYVSATQCAVNSGSGAAASAPETCSISASTLAAGSTYAFELQVTDSASTAMTTTSTASTVVTVASQLTAAAAPTVSATNGKLDVDQVLTVSGTIPSTGSSTYSWVWKVNDNGGGYVTATQCAVNSGSGAAASAPETCSISASTLTAGHTYIFELQVTDSANTAEVTTSSASTTITAASQLTAAAAPTVSATSINTNQAETVTGTIPSTGSSTYSWTWKINDNGGGYVTATQCAVNSGSGASASSTKTCAISGGTLTAGHTYVFELQVSDSANTPESTTSSASPTVTVSTAMSANLAANTISNAIIDDGQTETLTVSISGGTSPYTYNFLVTNTAVAAGLGGGTNVIFSSINPNALTTNSVSFTLPNDANTVGTLTFTANVVDSASTNVLTSVGINTFTAKALPVITLLSTFGGSLVNSISPNGNPTLVNALVTGGTGTYTFRWTLNNVNVANSMVSTTGSSNTFIATDHGAGTYVFNVIATDTGTTSSYDLVQVSNAMLVPSASGVSSSSGGGANVNTYTTTQTTTVTTTVGILQTSTNVSAGKASLGETINVSAGVNHNINFSNTQTSILITTSSSSPVAAVVHVTNVTVSSAAAPPGYQKLSATNVSVNSSAVVTLTLVTKYPCGLPASSVAPYKLSKGVWVPIKPFSVNTAACTVTLSIASNDPVVALMQSPQTTTAPTTSAYTTMPTSSIAPTTTIQQPAYTSGSSTTTVAVIVVVIIALALLAYWLLGRKKGYTAWKKKQ